MNSRSIPGIPDPKLSEKSLVINSWARCPNDVLIDAYHLMFEENNPAGIKAFLHEMGLLENIMRLPVTPLSGALHQQVKKYLNK